MVAFALCIGVACWPFRVSDCDGIEGSRCLKYQTCYFSTWWSSITCSFLFWVFASRGLFFYFTESYLWCLSSSLWHLLLIEITLHGRFYNGTFGLNIPNSDHISGDLLISFGWNSSPKTAQVFIELDSRVYMFQGIRAFEIWM